MSQLIIGFSKSKKKFPIISWLIRLVQNTEFSHVYLKRNSKYGPYVYQANGHGVNFTNIQWFLEQNEVTEEFIISVSDEVKDRIMKKAIELCGRPYSQKDIIGILLAQWFNIKSNLLADGEYAFICSELVVELLDSGGIVLKSQWGKTPELVTPKDIYQKLKEMYPNAL